MPIATNDKGDAVFLDSDGDWKPATLAEHPETKQRLAFDGKDWTPLPSKVTTGEAVGRGIMQGASFGFRDEGQGLIEAGGGGGANASPDALTNLGYLARGAYRKLTGDPEAEARYQAAVERERASTKQIEKERPGAYLGGNVLGAVTMPVGFAARAPTMLGRGGRLLAGTKTGALAGGLTGFGEGEGLGGSLTGAAIGAPVGAAVGGLATPAVEGLARGLGAAVSYPVSVARGLLTPGEASERAIGRALQQAERSDPGAVNRLTAAQLGQGGPAVVGDVLGEPGRRLARSAANISPEARETMNIALNARGDEQGARAITWLDNMFSFPNARAQQEALDATRRSANSAAYQAAERQGAGGLWSPELERLASSQGVANAMKTAVQTSQDEAVRRGAGGFNPKISFTPDGRIQFNRGPTGVPTYPDLQYWDQVRRELSDAARKAGRGTEEDMRLGGLAAALNTELDRMVPAYRVARRTAAGFFDARDALQAGQNFATQRFGADEARAALAQMNTTERALFRDGYISRMKDVLGATRDARDITKFIGADREARDKMAVALGPQRAREFQAMLQAENIMQKLKEAVQGNSSTVMQLLGAGAAGAGGGGYLGFDPTASGISSAVALGLKKGADANMARHITRLMMSRDPAVLQAGIRQIARNPRNLEIMQSVNNAVTRAAAEQAAQAIPGRQAGGPVEEDQPYLVGERGPEVIVPDRPGTVIPANGPMPSREEIQRYLAATTQNFPKVGAGGIPVNPEAFTAAVEGWPESDRIEDRRDERGGFEAAAARTRRSVKPAGGRREGAGTQFVEGGYGIPSVYRSLDEGARKAFEEGGKIQHYGNEYYDAGPVTQQALGAAGAPLVAPAMEGAVLGAGAIRRAAIPQVAKQELRAAEAAPEPVRIGRNAPEGGGVYPGIYRNPKEIAAEAAAQVAPEHPAMKELFGVTRDDLYQIGQQGRRAGNREPSIAAAKNPKGSYVAGGVINRENEGRILDAMKEAEKYPEFIKGMDSWYVMDPAFRRMVELVGPEQAIKDYKRFNTLTSMASPGSEVLTEINRGTAANMMAARGEFPLFQKYGGMAAANRGADFPPALRDVIGHPYHSTAQAGPMGRYLETGAVDMTQPKVPLYLQASGVPETGFQTKLPVPDAHFARALGVADVRRNANPGASMKTPEYAPIGPWFREKIAKPSGVEAVPGQARMWGLFSPQTGVDTPIGAPKLELLAQRIWERAQQLGVDPKKLRDDVLSGKAHASWLIPGVGVPGAASGVLQRGQEDEDF